MKKKVIFRSLFIILLSIIMAAPLFAKVERSIGRVLTQPDDIVVSNRKANFGIGDILNIDMASIYITNDEEPAYLLLELEIEIDSPSISGDTTATAKFVKYFGPGETFTFTNKDLLNYLDYYKTSNVPDSIKEAFGITGGIDSITESFFSSSSRDIPEGEYKISLLASEITSEDNYSVTGTELKAKQTVTFKVARIEELEIIKKPTVKDKTLTIKVPEIPYYSDGSIPNDSTTELIINGIDMENESLRKFHQRVTSSDSNALKGYPGDISDGIVTFDLKDIDFRAGETYNFRIEYRDAYTNLIKDKVFEIKFPTPKFSTTISIQNDNPFMPKFNWSFNDDYSSWVSEYRVYINDKSVKSYSDNYQINYYLNPSTTYSWYVMPINKDGTPFFSDSSNYGGSFTTKNHTDISLTINKPENHAILLLGNTYQFTGTPVYSDNCVQDDATWYIGQDSFDGVNVRYTPNDEFNTDNLVAYLHIEDNLGLEVDSDNIYLTVKEPKVALDYYSVESIFQDAVVTFSIDQNPQKTRNIESIEWYLNDKPIGNGANINYKFSDIGNFNIYAKATSVEDYLGNTNIIETEKIPIKVIGKAPLAMIELPQGNVQILPNTTLNIQSKYTSYNDIKSFEWTYSGAASGSLGSNDSEANFTPTKPGNYEVTYTVTDIFNQSDSASINVFVLDPQIQISNISANATYSTLTTLNPSVIAPNAIKLFYLINGKEVPNGKIELEGYSPNTYYFSVRGVWNVIDENGRVSTYEKESEKIPFNVIQKYPPKITFINPSYPNTFMEGETYNLKANVDSTSEIKKSTWSVSYYDSKGYSTSASLYSSRIIPSKYTSERYNQIWITYSVEDEDGLSNSKTQYCTVLYPKVTITTPSITDYPLSATINIEASVKDGKLFWLIDGKKQYSWDKQFSSIGKHTIQAGWEAKALAENGGTENYSDYSNEITIVSYSDKDPEIISSVPEANIIKHIINKPLTFNIAVSQGAELLPTQWSITDYYRNQVAYTYEGSELSYENWKEGIYKVKALSKDVYNRAVSKEWTVNVNNPIARINFPENGKTYALSQIENLKLGINDLDRYVLKLDGNEVSLEYDWKTLKEGSHTLSIQGFLEISTDSEIQETEEQTISFTMKDMTPPKFDIDVIKNNDRVISGMTYNIKAYGNANETFEWYVNGVRKTSGSSYRYQPKYQYSYPSRNRSNFNDRYYHYQNDYDIIKVIGYRNGLKLEKEYRVEIIKPYYYANTASSKIYKASGQSISLSSTSYGVDELIWKVDGRKTNNKTISFRSGTHTISLEGIAKSVRLPNGTLSDYTPNNIRESFDVEIFEQPKITSVNAPIAVLQGDEIRIKIDTSNSRFVSNYSCFIDGIYYKSSSNNEFNLKSLSAKNHTIKIVAYDIVGRESIYTHNISVYKPLVTDLILPIEGQRLSPDDYILGKLEIYSGEPKNIFWKFDNKTVNNSNNKTVQLGKLNPGRHTVEASVVDILNNTVTKLVNFETLTDFQLNMINPKSSVEIIVDNPINCMASVDKVVGSKVSLTDAARNITWFINDKATKNTGLSYDFPADKIGTYDIYAQYEFNNMIRTTDTRTIKVRNIVDPSILIPVNSETIIYSEGDKIELSAKGEIGAEYIWEINDEIIAVGANSEFDPKDMTGSLQIKLTTEAYGQSSNSLSTFTLHKNTPPTLGLQSKEIQYTGDYLDISVVSNDVEDDIEDLEVIVKLDGVIIEDYSNFVLNSAGKHTLTAIATDSRGDSTIKNMTIEVVEKTLPIQILSPINSYDYYKDFEIPLVASLSQEIDGTYSWVVNNLKNITLSSDEFNTQKAEFVPNEIGEYEITVSFTDSNNQERARKTIIIDIKNEPLSLNINWPHSSIVNQDTPIFPTLQGLPENYNENGLSWYLDGNLVRNIQNLRAPNLAGIYTLSAIYERDGISENASIDFSVNSKPEVIINDSISDKLYKIGDPIVLSATVNDDQEYNGNIIWSLEDETVIGKGNPLIFIPDSVSLYKIIASVEDEHLLKGIDEIIIETYEPINNIKLNINDDLPQYLISSDSENLALKVSYLGGNNPEVVWKIIQNETTLTKVGKNVEFSFTELKNLERTSALISVIIKDSYLKTGDSQEVYSNDYLLEFTDDSSIQIVKPLSSSVYRKGQTIPVEVALTGYKSPELTLTLNEIGINCDWVFSEDNRVAITTLSPQVFGKEGVYEIDVKALEYGALKSHVMSLNLYPNREGIFIDDAPSTFDKTQDSYIINATIANLNKVDTILWKTDLEIDPVSKGSSLDLNSIDLKAGRRIITAEAYSGDELLSSTKVIIDVIDKVYVNIQTDEKTMIIQKGADISLEVEAIDSDGSDINPEYIIWLSHENGYLITGKILEFADLNNLTEGVHVITVTATGKDGIEESDYISVDIKEGVVEQNAEAKDKDENREMINDGTPMDLPDRRFPSTNYFSLGSSINNKLTPRFSPPFGPGNNPSPDLNLEKKTNSFLSTLENNNN